MPTPARRAISSSGASRPWSQNTCRAAARMASRLRWASRRSGLAGRGGLGWSAVVMEVSVREYGGLPPHYAGRLHRSEGYLRFLERGRHEHRGRDDGTRRRAGGGRGADPDDGAACAGGAARPRRALRAVRSLHPRARPPRSPRRPAIPRARRARHPRRRRRSEEHTSELQSRVDLVCRLLLEKKKKNEKNIISQKKKKNKKKEK